MPDFTDWLAQSRFSTQAARSRAALELLGQLIEDRGSKDATPPPSLNEEAASILEPLTSPLKKAPPEASQDAEAALTLAAFCLVEERPLNVTDVGAGDLTPNGRIASDRGVSDAFCRDILSPRNIPATKGPFQSSSFRSGYLAAQVRSVALPAYARWQSSPDRELEEVHAVAIWLADAFAGAASKLPAWPAVVGSKLTFTAYRRIRDALLSQGSGGAFEQYFLAGLLEQELAMEVRGLRVETKNVGANDRAARTAGDIQVRHRQALVSAIEVSAANWASKVSQIEASAAAGLKEVTIAATGVSESTGADIARLIDPIAARLGIDPAVVDLHAFMDVVASRITPHGRAEALRFVYRALVQYHSREPMLAERLITAMHDAQVLAGEEEAVELATEEIGDLEVALERVRIEYDGQPAILSVVNALRKVALELEAEAIVDEQAEP